MSSIDSNNDNSFGCLTLLLCVAMFFVGSCTGANSVYEEAQNRGLGEMKDGNFVWNQDKEQMKKEK